MKALAENFKLIFEKHKMLLFGMMILLIVSVALFIFTILNLGTNATVVKVSYGDIGRYQGGEVTAMANSGGYLDGVWTERFAYPILAVVFGIFHNLLAVKLFEKKGRGMAGLFVIFSITVVIATFIVFGRLLGEA